MPLLELIVRIIARYPQYATNSLSAIFYFAHLKALVWFWLIDETLSANLIYQDDYEIGNTTPSDEAMTKIMMMVMA